MKLAILFSLLFSLVSPPVVQLDKVPHINAQWSKMIMHQYSSPTWERHIFLRNPTPKAIWCWIECESHLTTVAIGIAGRHTSEIVLPDIPPAEECMLNHWRTQEPGKSPPEWRP